MTNIIHFKTINQFNIYNGFPLSKNPDVSVLFYDEININKDEKKRTLRDFYSIGFVGEAEGHIKYGDGLLDFSDGQIVFLGINQISQSAKFHLPDNGWNLNFSAELISGSSIHNFVKNYPFFRYKSKHALKLKKNEVEIITDIVRKINDLSFNANTKWSNILIINYIELMLNYFMSFHEKNKPVNVDIDIDKNSYIDQFELLLGNYYKDEMQKNHGLPNVKYFGDAIGVSPYYLSTLIKKVTFKSANTHINTKIMDEAKHYILTGELSISQISSNLGFKNSQHFSKFFKSKQGESPSEYIKMLKSDEIIY